jgi:hypothetical protein
MDWFLIYITIGSLVALDLLGHYLIVDRQVNRLRAESKRIEAAWRAFLDELKEAVKKGKK